MIATTGAGTKMQSVPKDVTILYHTDFLTGILKGDYDLNQAREERLIEKYEVI